MTLNLNDAEDLTIKRVGDFIASVDDSANRQLRVTAGGIASISDTVAGRNLEGLAFSIEAWAEGNGLVGPRAAKNEEWVKRVHALLKGNWPKPKDTFIDQY